VITSPRWIERLLASCGAERRYRETVLGDLAEEFSIRVEEQGIGVARRWYYREALRSVPHLLRSWIRGLTARDVLRLAGATIAAGVVSRLLSVLIPLAIVMWLGVRPDSIDIVAIAWRDVLRDTVYLKWFALASMRTVPLAAGFVAASLYPRGRMIATLAVASINVLYGVVGLAIVTPLSPWLLLSMSVLPTSLTVLGGATRVLFGGDECIQGRTDMKDQEPARSSP
jgi:hypothetical protein